MTDRDIQDAKAEAQRFLRRLDELAACTKHSQPFDSCPSRAAVRRASMDLTRALARLRAR